MKKATQLTKNWITITPNFSQGIADNNKYWL